MFLLNLYFITVLCTVRGYELQQVVVLGRHNIRAPVVMGSDLQLFTEKEWPEWDYAPGVLTQKGGALERSMGKYFSDWLIKEKLFSDNCPRKAFVYANTEQRTVETAKSFVNGAFGDCVKVYYKNMTGNDPVFDTIIRNNSTAFKELVLEKINRKLDATDLDEPFLELDRILHLQNSTFCKTITDCALSQFKDEIFYEINEIPQLKGPLGIAAAVLDSFLMSYYEGREPEDVAWGEITTNEQWKSLWKISKTYMDVLFNTQPLARDQAEPLLELMKQTFLRDSTKFYMLVGHDLNIVTVMSSLNIKYYALHDQFEKTPIGGKVVFEKWYDAVNEQHLLRISFVYQSTQQIRDGAVPSLRNPPERQFLELEGCVINENGFCLWADFVNILKRL